MLIHYTFIVKILYINITNFSLYWFFISYDDKDLCVKILWAQNNNRIQLIKAEAYYKS